MTMVLSSSNFAEATLPTRTGTDHILGRLLPRKHERLFRQHHYALVIAKAVIVLAPPVQRLSSKANAIVAGICK